MRSGIADDLTDDLDFLVLACLAFSSSVVLSSTNNVPPSSAEDSPAAGSAKAAAQKVIVVFALDPDVIVLG